MPRRKANNSDLCVGESDEDHASSVATPKTTWFFGFPRAPRVVGDDACDGPDDITLLHVPRHALAGIGDSIKAHRRHTIEFWHGDEIVHGERAPGDDARHDGSRRPFRRWFTNA